MATTIRGSLGGREKRGTSPSSSLTKKSIKPSSQSLGSSSSSTGTNQKTSTPSDGKSVPNYLKPTRSTNQDTSANKRSGTDSGQKPMLNRRRSFDRPPPTNQVHKAIRNVPGTREVKPVRSVSFSHKIGTSSLAPSSTRPASDRTYARTTSSLKEGKIEPVVSKSRSIRKGTLSSSLIPTTKKDKNGLKSALYAKKAPKSVTSESSNDHDTQSIDHLVDDDDLVNMDIEVQSLPEMSEMPDTDQELGDPTIILTDVEAKTVENVQHNVAVSDQQNVDDQVAEDIFTNADLKQDDEDEQTAENQAETQNVEHHDDDQNITAEDQNVTDEEQNVTVDDHPNVTVEDHAMPTAEEENPNETSEEQNQTVEEQNVTAEPSDAAADIEERNVEQTMKESPEEKKENAELQKEAEKKAEEKQGKDENATVTLPAQASAGKKDKQDYNDVIEETATKLMGGKKNKVLALAGAFETVISLQDTNKN